MGNSYCHRLDCSGLLTPREYATVALCHASSPSSQLCSNRLRSPDVRVSAEHFKRCRLGRGESAADISGLSCATGDSGCDGAEEEKIASWRDYYAVGRVLGKGQSATVYEAFSIDAHDGGARDAATKCVGACGVGCDAVASGDVGGSGSQQPPGRRVALKHFLRSNSLMLRRELVTLAAVGSHPNITRLLEFFEGGADGDALILEYCDGGDMYDFYAASKGQGVHEAIVGQIMRQVLAALSHLVLRKVDHRDLKPENLLLYGSTEPYPNVKLADFGWAMINRESRKLSLPPDGVGSLWYAPPELNPPLPGSERLSEAPLGRSDMWSAGVITFLLLIGHNPFNMALAEKETKAMEQEVIRMAALGEVNTRTRRWSTLSDEAKHFILELIQPNPNLRPQPHEALKHPFIVKCSSGEVGLPGAVVSDHERKRVWRSMDGFQQLCWMSLASAVSEPELLQECLNRHFCFQAGQAWDPGCYLEHLAAELAVVATPDWFHAKSRRGWAHMARLAFTYLDIDGDGLISAVDLLAHAESKDEAMVLSWFETWRNGPRRLPVQSGLQFSDFRWTLWLTCIRSQTQNTRSPVAFPAVALHDFGGAADIDFVDDFVEDYVDQVLYPGA